MLIDRAKFLTLSLSIASLSTLAVACAAPTDDASDEADATEQAESAGKNCYSAQTLLNKDAGSKASALAFCGSFAKTGKSAGDPTNQVGAFREEMCLAIVDNYQAGAREKTINCWKADLARERQGEFLDIYECPVTAVGSTHGHVAVCAEKSTTTACKGGGATKTECEQIASAVVPSTRQNMVGCMNFSGGNLHACVEGLVNGF